MNDDVVLALGELASSLQRSPQFELLGQYFEQQVAADVLQTKPHEAEERERLYMRRQGYLAFLQHLGLFAAKYAELTERPPERSDDDEIDDPSVHDF